uniref:Galactose-3-o-sulfotransferase n=2 Tax=Rhodnius prolixus TaxID=13249 RepID=T1HAU9_RHOPR
MNTKNERDSILFLKAHKCASTTVQNILMRFGYSKGLDFVLPSSGNYIGNPTPFAASLIPTELTSPSRKYHIFTHHTRYNYSAMRSVMKPDCKFVTILRDPATLYESLFNFYHLERITRVSFHELLTSKTKWPLLKHRYLKRLGLNQMAWDLGYAPEISIENFIANLDKEFDLVMISEFMEASLVLLARLMNWPLSNVITLKLNARPENRRSLTEDERSKLMELNSIDTILYDYFAKKFHKTILNYGKEKLKHDVMELLKLNSDLRRNCVDKMNNRGYAGTTNYDLRNNLNWTCVYSAKMELAFTDEIRNDQKERFKTIKKLDALLEVVDKDSD